MSGELIYVCEICQTVLDERHGEAVCPNCGRKLDCSDLSTLPANGRVDEEDRLVLRPGSDPVDLMPRPQEPGQSVPAEVNGCKEKNKASFAGGHGVSGGTPGCSG